MICNNNDQSGDAVNNRLKRMNSAPLSVTKRSEIYSEGMVYLRNDFCRNCLDEKEVESALLQSNIQTKVYW